MSQSTSKRVFAFLRARARSAVHEARTHADRIRQPKRELSAVLFPSQSDSGGSGYLRARAVGTALRSFGWRTLVPDVSLSLAQRRRIISMERPDVIVLQQARHPLNRPRLYKGVPCVFDLDDADLLDPRCEAEVIECTRESIAVVAGSRYVAELLRPYNSDVSVVWTCVDSDMARTVPLQSAREPVIAWASLNPSGFSMEAELIQQSMIALAGRTAFTFRLYGATDPWGVRKISWAQEYVSPIQAAGATVELIPLMQYPDFLASLESVAIGLQPVCPESEHSRGRSFGKILAYLSAGTAVVASRAADHPLFFRDGLNGLLVDNKSPDWTRACAGLLEDVSLRERVALGGRSDLGRRLVANTGARYLDVVLRRAISRRSQTAV
jgi:hypothetical protein